MKTMKPLRNTLLLAIMLLVANVMLAQSNDNTNNNPFSGYQKTRNGLYYKLYTQGEGIRPQIDNLLDVNLSCMVNDTVVIIPNSENTIQMIASQFAGDFFEGLAMMHVGDSASFIVNVDSTFIKMFGQPNLPEGFNSTDVMRFEVRLIDCYPESEYPLRFNAKLRKETERKVAQMKADHPNETAVAAQQLAEYLASKKIKAEQTASGLYYLRTKEGNGERPMVGQQVTVHYIGKLLDGTVFDSSYDRGKPFVVTIGVGQVIPGWDEGILLMSKGEKGVLYIPYYLAYGERAAGEEIAPFSNLIFEVELIDFH